MLFHINHHLWDRGIMSNSTHNSKNYIELPFGKLMYLGSKKIVVVDSPITKQKLEIKSKINADVVVIAHNPKLDIQTLANVLGFQKIVFDSSNKIWRVNRWKQDCSKLGIQFWDVNEQGAYIDS